MASQESEDQESAFRYFAPRLTPASRSLTPWPHMSFPIAQAIFTSLRGERLAGYQLSSRSRGIDDDTAQQLSNWGPAHDSIETRLSRSSVNVHALSSDRTCISYTQLAGAEYSGRSGGRVYTHSFILPTEALAHFQSNPLAILRAFRSAGRTQPRRDPPAELDAFQLVGRATGSISTRQNQVHTLLADSEREKLICALSAERPVFLAGDEPLESLFEAVLHLLPDEMRSRVSFTTGLRTSPRRPFQLQAVAADPVVIRQLKRDEQALVLQVPIRNRSPVQV